MFLHSTGTARAITTANTTLDAEGSNYGVVIGSLSASVGLLLIIIIVLATIIVMIKKRRVVNEAQVEEGPQQPLVQQPQQ